MYKKYISVLASMALVSAGAMAQNDSIKSSLSPSQPAPSAEVSQLRKS
ncbi:hypothetical protein [uncultured Muribaculum sp.]|nr:hypothetical protein [uncultured Muribaculum sp.]